MTLFTRDNACLVRFFAAKQEDLLSNGFAWMNFAASVVSSFAPGVFTGLCCLVRNWPTLGLQVIVYLRSIV